MINRGERFVSLAAAGALAAAVGQTIVEPPAKPAAGGVATDSEQESWCHIITACFWQWVGSSRLLPLSLSPCLPKRLCGQLIRLSQSGKQQSPKPRHCERTNAANDRSPHCAPPLRGQTALEFSQLI
jgi:hypothetical protein